MAQHRTPLLDEFKELISLIRQGRLFDVQQWIRDGKAISLPDEGRFAISPAMAAVRTGFHSMAKVLLDAAADKQDLDDLLVEAVSLKRLDLCMLLHEYGAKPCATSYESVASTHNPLILRWFEEHGIDLETEYPLATALRWRIRAALGTYMRKKEQMPQLKQQLEMALRFHATKGDMKWVSLLLWAGADPIKRYVRSLGWTLKGDWFRRDPKPIVDCLCLLAAKGMKWNPVERHEYRYLRKGLSRAQSSVAKDVLTRLVRAGLFTEEVFKELVSTPRMREVIGPGRYSASPLREFAGFEAPQQRRRRQQRVG